MSTQSSTVVAYHDFNNLATDKTIRLPILESSAEAYSTISILFLVSWIAEHNYFFRIP